MPSQVAKPAAILLHRETERLHLATFSGGKAEESSCVATSVDSGNISPKQFATWVWEQLKPDSAQSAVCHELRLGGRLKLPDLAKAFREVVWRNDILRLHFMRMEGLQAARLPLERFLIETVDLTAMRHADQKDVVGRIRQCFQVAPFGRSLGSRIRGIVLIRDADDHILLLAVDRMLADRWSLALIISQIFTLYAAGAPGEDGLITPLQSTSQGEATPSDNTMPRRPDGQSLDAIDLPILNLPVDRRHAAQHNEMARYEFRLDTNKTRLLTLASQALSEEPATLLLASFCILIGRLSCASEVTVMTERHNRSAGSVRLIGPLACMVPVHVSLAGQPSFSMVIARVNAACTQAACLAGHALETFFEHQARQQASTRVQFQTGFDYVETIPETLQCEGLNLSSRTPQPGWDKHELALAVARRQEMFDCAFTYSADLFLPETVRSFAGAFERVLGAACSDPGREIGLHDLLTETERHEILVKQSMSTSMGDDERSVFDELTLHASRVPGKTAAACGNQSLSYGALDDLSNRLAGLLRRAGIQPGSCIAVCGPRNLAMLVAMLGIMRASAVYLPLDPILPDAQIAFMVQDAKADLVLASIDAIGRFTDASLTILTLEEAIEIAKRGLPYDGPTPCPENLAYMMYTSGSTGHPKGVMISHSGMWNHVWAKARDLQLQDGDIVAQTASSSFDISIWQFLSPLAAGATVSVLPDDVATDGNCLVKELQRLSITTWETVPVLLGLIVDQQELVTDLDRLLPALRCVVSNAEALTTDLARRWQKLYPEIDLLNTYGATETSDDVAHYWIGPAYLGQTVHVPLGTPIGGSTVYVLDNRMEPVLSCMPGEIYIGGPGVAPGYLNQPALTAERFVPDCFSSRPGDRLYRTGDRGRWLANGDLEFLGRVDQQTKVRGHRVEPDEIASILRRHPKVRQAAVLAVKPAGTAGNARLAAFVVRRLGTAGDLAELRAFVRANLPDYMVPASFIELSELPLTSNGKLDRRSLQNLLLTSNYAAPTSPTEGILAEIFAEVLQRQNVGIRDDFFALGGTARDAVHLLDRIHMVLGVDVPLRKVYESATIEALTIAIESINMGCESRSEPELTEARFLLLDRMMRDEQRVI